MQNEKLNNRYILNTDKLAVIIGLIDKFLIDNYGNDIFDFLDKAKKYNQLAKTEDKKFDPVAAIMVIISDEFNNGENVEKLNKNILSIIKSSTYDMLDLVTKDWKTEIISKEIFEDALEDSYNQLPFFDLDDSEKLNIIFDLINIILTKLYSKKICRINAEELFMSQQPVGNIFTKKKNKIITSTALIKDRNSKFDEAIFHQLTTSLTSEQLEQVVLNLSDNVTKFEELFKGKIWIVESDFTKVIKEKGRYVLPRETRLVVSPGRFFHLMGFDYKCLIGEEKGFGNKTDNLAQLIKLCGKENELKIHRLLEEYSKECAEFKKNSCNANLSQEDLLKLKQSTIYRGNCLYEILLLIIKNNERFLNMLGEGKLNGIISIPKLTMKQYAFDRMKIITDASGILVFDKSIATLHEKNIKTGNAIYLLSDIIKDNKLSFIFSEFKDRESTFGEKNASSIFVGQKSKFENDEFYEQFASVSSTASAYSPHDFNFSIKQGNENPVNNRGTGIFDLSASGNGPIKHIVYNDEEKYNIACSILSAISNLKNKDDIQKYALEIKKRIRENVNQEDQENQNFKRK